MVAFLRRRAALLIGLVGLALLPLAAWGALRWGAGWLLSRQLRLPVSIGHVWFSRNEMILRDVTLRNPNVLSADQVRWQGDFRALLRRETFPWEVTGSQLHLGEVPVPGHVRLQFRPTAEGGWACDGRLFLAHPIGAVSTEIHGDLTDLRLEGAFRVGEERAARLFSGALSIEPDGIRITRTELPGKWGVTGTWRPHPAADGTAPLQLTLTGPNGWYDLSGYPLSDGGQLRLVLRRSKEPDREMAVEWRQERSQLDLIAQLMDQGIAVAGRVNLAPPYGVDMDVNFAGAQISELLQWILPSAQRPAVSGALLGQVALRGNLDSLDSVGDLVSRQGSIGPQRFDSAALRFEGEGPILKLRDSLLNRSSTVTRMEGQVDLRRIGRPDFFREVELSSSEEGKS
ncbi:MAG: hypothetical protein COV76_04770 [Candidatus Omnitrophica bacterium CG11_big_fil_rev_8_21_14_0_20_64_10]|nr:MAG: hypothetical protein COV76_04770 [Candidatus Omnitrophica bacterium CG11_big_fil_rev_8_21_14_0_20_64_10]